MLVINKRIVGFADSVMLFTMVGNAEGIEDGFDEGLTDERADG